MKDFVFATRWGRLFAKMWGFLFAKIWGNEVTDYKCLLGAYCESYNELMEYDAAALILNIVYRGITSNLR